MDDADIEYYRNRLADISRILTMGWPQTHTACWLLMNIPAHSAVVWC